MSSLAFPPKLRALRNARGERGDVNVLFAFFLIFLVAFMAFGIDASLMLTKKLAIDTMFQSVREVSVDTSSSLVAKNSADPDRVIAKDIAASARKAGYEGSLKVYFYEIPKSQVPNNQGNYERLYVYQAVAEDPYTPLFSPLFGSNTINISSTFVVSCEPYSEIAIWRPPSTKSTVWELPAQQTVDHMTSSSTALSSMPKSIQDAVTQLLNP